MLAERWVSVIGYDGFYSVSDYGRVRSEARVSMVRKIKERILRPGRNKGHLLVALCRGGKPRTFEVHRLVALSFLGPCPVGQEVCHNDGDGENNHLTNLRYDTRSANVLDRATHGTMVQGSKHHGAVITEALIPEIRARLAAGEVQRVIAESYGVTETAIWLINSGKTWKHVPPEA